MYKAASLTLSRDLVRNLVQNHLQMPLALHHLKMQMKHVQLLQQLCESLPKLIPDLMQFPFLARLGESFGHVVVVPFGPLGANALHYLIQTLYKRHVGGCSTTLGKKGCG